MLIYLLISLVKALVVIGFALNVVPLLIYLERKISAYIQGRVGPNRVNLVLGNLLPKGLLPPGMSRLKLIPGSLQPLADAIKLAFKEEIIPAQADRLLWHLGPVVAFLPVGMALAFIPFGTPAWNAWGVNVDLRVASANAGILALLAVSSLAVYGIAVGGWGSGSKFPLMGAVRSSAQMISYEVAMGLALVAAIATAGSVDLQQFVLEQANGMWLVFVQPVAALVFIVAMFAENNRLPFDLPECEPELVGGYHTEYTGLKFALFFLGEYVAMIVMSGVFVTIFLGGWSFPGLTQPVTALAAPVAAGATEVVVSSAAPFPAEGTLYVDGDLITYTGKTATSFTGCDGALAHGRGVHLTAGARGVDALLSALVFVVKLMFVLTFQIWIRWTLPRFRYDQLMSLGWKVMVPLALGNLVLTAVAITFLC